MSKTKRLESEEAHEREKPLTVYFTFSRLYLDCVRAEKSLFMFAFRELQRRLMSIELLGKTSRLIKTIYASVYT